MLRYVLSLPLPLDHQGVYHTFLLLQISHLFSAAQSTDLENLVGWPLNSKNCSSMCELNVGYCYFVISDPSLFVHCYLESNG